MKAAGTTRRTLVAIVMLAGATGCQLVPQPSPRTSAPPPPPVSQKVQTPPIAPAPVPARESARRQIALLVPLSGENAAVGQSIANAANMAVLDTNATSLRITTYDTGTDAGDAARRAIADGNGLIVGPLLAEEIGPVASAAAPGGVPVLAFSNNSAAAGPGAFVMGHLPEQSINRSILYASRRGAHSFAAIVPEGEYGDRAEAALRVAVTTAGGRVAKVERFSRNNTSIVSAAQRVAQGGLPDAVLIAEGPRLAGRAAAQLREGGDTLVIGTDLWLGDGEAVTTPSLRGAIYSSVSDANFRGFQNAYRTRYGSAPYRIATFGYDAVLMALKVGDDWRAGRPFPAAALGSSESFLGIDGPFRFTGAGTVARAMEVRRITANGTEIVDPAPEAVQVWR